METEIEEAGLQERAPVSAPVVSNPIYMGIALSIAFATGLMVGLIGRPWLIGDVPVQVVVTVVPNTNAGETVATEVLSSAKQVEEKSTAEANISGSAASSANKPVEVSGSPTPTLMEFVLADARHSLGDKTAPVTIVEFSDFK